MELRWQLAVAWLAGCVGSEPDAKVAMDAVGEHAGADASAAGAHASAAGAHASAAGAHASAAGAQSASPCSSDCSPSEAAGSAAINSTGMCFGRNEAACNSPCFAVRAYSGNEARPRFVECSDSELGGNTAITCGISPDNATCLRFTTTLIAMGWRVDTSCQNPLCSDHADDAGLPGM
jgi:hypothetical protein